MSTGPHLSSFRLARTPSSYHKTTGRRKAALMLPALPMVVNNAATSDCTHYAASCLSMSVTSTQRLDSSCCGFLTPQRTNCFRMLELNLIQLPRQHQPNQLARRNSLPSPNSIVEIWSVRHELNIPFPDVLLPTFPLLHPQTAATSGST